MGIKAHLGCWHRVIPGFLHVDLCDMPHIDYKSNIDALPFFADSSVELIYCSHALNHLDRSSTKKALREWFRVLQPGGVLRLAVPNFDALLQVYNQTQQLDRIIGPLYGMMEIQTLEGLITLYHKTTYNEESLTRLLIDEGYVNLRRWDWRKTEHAMIDDHSQAYFPHMRKETGILVSLNMEAQKP